MNLKNDKKPEQQDKKQKSTSKKPELTFYKLITDLQRSNNATASEEGVLSLYLIINAFGQFLYRLGYETEYVFLCAKRALIAFFGAAKIQIATLFLKIGNGCVRLGKILAYDFVEPWRRAKSGYNNIKAEINEQREASGNKAAALKGFTYFWSGVCAYAHLLMPILWYLLPAGALVVFVFTVNTIMNYNFALTVEVNGEVIGIVEDQNVFEDAQSLVRMRIRSTKDGQEWNLEPRFSLVAADKAATYSRTTLADKIVETSSEDIQNATGIMVENELIGVTTNGEVLQATLDTIREPFQDPTNTNLTVDFVKKVELIPGLYFTSSIADVNDIVNVLTSQVSGEKIYKIQKGDSPSLIAQKNDITLNDLYALNAHMQEPKYRMPIGEELLIAKEQPFLQVKTVERVKREVTVEHQTVRNNSEDVLWGVARVLTQGEDGLNEQTVDIVRVDGIAVSEEIIDTIVLKEPVTQEELVGIKNYAGGVAGDASTGEMIWPVPGMKGVSRGYAGHRGIDIRGNRGTPILAADNGIVSFAGRASGSYWSYGNYVKLQHSTGVATIYAHCSSVAVSNGQYVKKGEVIAYVGSTGNSTGNHCHFETQVGGRPINPYNFVKRPW